MRACEVNSFNKNKTALSGGAHTYTVDKLTLTSMAFQLHARRYKQNMQQKKWWTEVACSTSLDVSQHPTPCFTSHSFNRIHFFRYLLDTSRNRLRINSPFKLPIKLCYFMYVYAMCVAGARSDEKRRIHFRQTLFCPFFGENFSGAKNAYDWGAEHRNIDIHMLWTLSTSFGAVIKTTYLRRGTRVKWTVHL